MAEITATVRPTREEVVPSRKRVKLPAWLEVAKPRLIPLLLATTLGGMALSEGWPLSSPRLVCTLGGGALASAAAGVLNCLWEQDLDGRMARTSGRALPSGRLSPTSAFIGAITCTLAAAMLLVSGVNCLAAGLSLLGLCSYVLLYTALLKPRTSQNIVIGGVAGAIPPLVGAAAATGHVGLGGWWLFALVMVWTPAHFWALALLLREDYRAVGIPMLPVVKGPVVTARAIKTYGWITVLLSGLGRVCFAFRWRLLWRDAAALQRSIAAARRSAVPGSRQSCECQGPVPLVDPLSVWSVPASHSQPDGSGLRLCSPGDATSLPANGGAMSTL